MKLKELFYFPLWYFKIRFLKKKIPLQTVLFISNVCNFNCKHCMVDKSTKKQLTYNEIKELLEYSYKKGSRFIDFEGGEPTLWKENNKNINDLCVLAKSIGFYSTTVTTNASHDFSYLNADHVFVSLDGINSHDIIRQKNSFENLQKNIKNFPRHDILSVNMVINSINKNEVGDTVQFVEKNPYIHGISFNFYSDFTNNPQLNINNEDKQIIIDKIIALKKQGYNIINTKTGLKNLTKQNIKKVCWITNFITVEKQKFPACANINKQLCNNCALGMMGEMRALYDFNFETIFNGLKLRKNK